jgi:predicted RNA binding protein YcfA (HicA-like mRNA interferase family)
MSKFPIDAPKGDVIKTLERLGFRMVREKEHISMERENPDGSKTPLTMPNHSKNEALYLEDHLHPSAVPYVRSQNGGNMNAGHQLHQIWILLFAKN